MLIFFLLAIETGTFLYFKKDQVVQYVLKHANEDFKGFVQIEKANISPFSNFPYISVKLQQLKVFETKKKIH